MSQLPDIPTSEYLSALITQLRKLDGLNNQTVSGIRPYHCIQFLFKNIQPKTNQNHIYQLEYDFVNAVASALLNAGRIGSQPRLQPRASQVQSIRRMVFRHGDIIPTYRETGFALIALLPKQSVVAIPSCFTASLPCCLIALLPCWLLFQHWELFLFCCFLRPMCLVFCLSSRVAL
ncbi:hypothetical protein F4804DRAFT_92912 [Jackrogersella minutella]|nr:hypothetical protein F4804DRAFT_92912 [Jackrogersella minutella]